jgi:hypothetical protein
VNISLPERFYNWLKLIFYDTPAYIYIHGWKEYRLARQRYDRHQEAVKNIESRYSKVGEIKMRNRMAKKKR